jgi:hypothetical protein
VSPAAASSPEETNHSRCANGGKVAEREDFFSGAEGAWPICRIAWGNLSEFEQRSGRCAAEDDSEEMES